VKGWEHAFRGCSGRKRLISWGHIKLADTQTRLSPMGSQVGVICLGRSSHVNRWSEGVQTRPAFTVIARAWLAASFGTLFCVGMFHVECKLKIRLPYGTFRFQSNSDQASAE
jgi:hypothetical protein